MSFCAFSSFSFTYKSFDWCSLALSDKDCCNSSSCSLSSTLSASRLSVWLCSPFSSVFKLLHWSVASLSCSSRPSASSTYAVRAFSASSWASIVSLFALFSASSSLTCWEEASRPASPSLVAASNSRILADRLLISAWLASVPACFALTSFSSFSTSSLRFSASC